MEFGTIVGAMLFRTSAYALIPTVSSKDENDPITFHRADAEFRVDTDPNVVRRFIKRGSTSIKVIFSTYQSSPIVSEGLRGLPRLDIAVFDEAHKTTGRKGGLFRSLPL